VKWLAIMVGGIAAAVVASFAIYTFGWRESDSDSDRASAQAFASELVADCGETCEFVDVEEVAPQVWRTKILGRTGATYCFNIHLDRFAPNLDEDFFDGVAGTACPAEPTSP
jgi:hypothetical protein